MQDRLGFSTQHRDEDRHTRTTVTHPVEQPKEVKLDDYFGLVKTVEDTISLIEKQTKMFERIQDKSLNSTKSPQTKQLSQQSNQIIDEVTQNAKLTKSTLKNMEASNQAYIQKNGQIAEARIRQNQHQALVTKFLDAMETFQNSQEKYKSKFRADVSRRCKIVDHNITEDEVDEYIKTGNSGQIFSVVDSQSYQEARGVLEEIEIKHSEILNLEKSINEIQQLFIDMSNLVQLQGEHLNTIEDNVFKSVDYVEKGVEELQQARVYQKKSRRKLCCIICLVLTIMIALSLTFGLIFK